MAWGVGELALNEQMMCIEMGVTVAHTLRCIGILLSLGNIMVGIRGVGLTVDVHGLVFWFHLWHRTPKQHVIKIRNADREDTNTNEWHIPLSWRETRVVCGGLVKKDVVRGGWSYVQIHGSAIAKPINGHVFDLPQASSEDTAEQCPIQNSLILALMYGRFSSFSRFPLSSINVFVSPFL